MNANVCLRAKVEDGTVVIHMPHHNGSITLIGASCETNIGPGRVSKAVTAVPSRRKSLVAVSVQYQVVGRFGPETQRDSFTIPITWDGSKHIAILDAPFVPMSDRLLDCNSPRITGDSLCVVTRGQRFVYAPLAQDGELAGMRVVTNPTLLLQYVLGEKNWDDLEAGATLDVRSQLERDLQQYADMAGRMADELNGARVTIARKDRDLRDLECKNETLRQSLEECLENLRNALSATRKSYNKLIGELRVGPPLRRRSTLIARIQSILRELKD